MKSLVILIFSCLTVHVASGAGNFSPTLLKLRAPEVLNYSYEGQDLYFPVYVTGTPAGLIFCVFTKDMAASIPYSVNGYLGWHQVNKVDTCIYHSPLKSVNIGETTYTWDGHDQDGNLIASGLYTYYIWAFDNHSEKQQMTKFMPAGWAFDYTAAVQEKDMDGLPLANPIWYRADSRWEIGSDPYNEAQKDSCTITLAEGWQTVGEPCIDPRDFTYEYVAVRNNDLKLASIQKLKWIPGGTAEIQTDWGEENGYATVYATAGGGSAGVVTDGDYLYTTDENHVASVDPDAQFYIYDYEGTMVKEIDLTTWWSNADDYAAYGQMNGGPNNFFVRNGNIFLNCHCSCLIQMADPKRYLETKEYDDFYIWTNGNGDYTLDHNFEETATLKWVCNDYNVAPYKSSISADVNLFSTSTANDLYHVSFGLLAPDGSGLGYYVFGGKTSASTLGTVIIDGDTPYDGLYCEYNQLRDLTHYSYDSSLIVQKGIYFIGHDSIKGTLLMMNLAQSVENVPAAFSLAQNTPNPFNPATTIRFSLGAESRVTLDVFAVNGVKVTTLAERTMSAGEHEVVWDASGFPSGVYFCRLKAGTNEKTIKMTLVK